MHGAFRRHLLNLVVSGNGPAHLIENAAYHLLLLCRLLVLQSISYCITSPSYKDIQVPRHLLKATQKVEDLFQEYP